MNTELSRLAFPDCFAPNLQKAQHEQRKLGPNRQVDKGCCGRRQTPEQSSDSARDEIFEALNSCQESECRTTEIGRSKSCHSRVFAGFDAANGQSSDDETGCQESNVGCAHCKAQIRKQEEADARQSM